jgi:hypothetical protein
MRAAYRRELERESERDRGAGVYSIIDPLNQWQTINVLSLTSVLIHFHILRMGRNTEYSRYLNPLQQNRGKGWPQWVTIGAHCRHLNVSRAQLLNFHSRGPLQCCLFLLFILFSSKVLAILYAKPSSQHGIWTFLINTLMLSTPVWLYCLTEDNLLSWLPACFGFK